MESFEWEKGECRGSCRTGGRSITGKWAVWKGRMGCKTTLSGTIWWLLEMSTRWGLA